MKANKEENLRKTSIQAMTLVLKECILNLINDLGQYSIIEKRYIEPKEISEIKLELFKNTKPLMSELEKSLGNRDEYISKLEELKQKLIQVSKPVFYFDGCLKYSFNFVSEVVKLNQLKETKLMPLGDANPIVEECESFLEFLEDEKFLTEIAKQRLMSSVPTLMTKVNYNDFVKQSFQGMLSNVNRNNLPAVLEELKSRFDILNTDSIKNLFPLIADKISEILKMDLSEKSAEELDELLSILEETQNELTDIQSDFSMILNDINYLICVAKYSLDVQNVFDDDFELKDLFYSACELYTSESAEAFAEPIIENSEKRIENLFDEKEAVQKTLSKYIEKISEDEYNDLNEDTQVFINLAMAVSELFNQELYECCIADLDIYSDTPATEEDKNEIAEKFLQYINELSEKYPNKVIKKLKQEFFNVLPCIFDNDNLLGYLFMVVDKFKDKASIYIILDNIITAFEQFGYQSELQSDECDCGHDHNHHDHDCSCGHNHNHDHSHHNHDCSCGHHHH